jgi:hypothetical protein
LVRAPNGRYTSARVPYAILGKQVVRQRLLMDRLAGLGYGGWATRDNEDEAQRLVHLLPVVAGFSLRRRYLWSVLIGEAEDEPRARFVTDPLGVREVFRLRDVPPGKQRRAALLHWVRAHWRRRRQVTEADKLWIRAHLRGAWSYTWNGLRCEIEPSELDVEEAQTPSLSQP